MQPTKPFHNNQLQMPIRTNETKEANLRVANMRNTLLLFPLIDLCGGYFNKLFFSWKGNDYRPNWRQYCILSSIVRILLVRLCFYVCTISNNTKRNLYWFLNTYEFKDQLCGIFCTSIFFPSLFFWFYSLTKNFYVLCTFASGYFYHNHSWTVCTINVLLMTQ